MKLARILYMLLAVAFAVLAIGPFSTSCADTAENAEGERPQIKLTYIPKYGSTKNIKGKVYFESGAKVKAKSYRVTCFLQVETNGDYWIKPTWAKPYVKLRSSGSFSLDYTTGGMDEQAVALHVMLIPADYQPTSFSDTRENAIAYLRIDRTSNGECTVTDEMGEAN